jgi:hypothetical protein
MVDRISGTPIHPACLAALTAEIEKTLWVSEARARRRIAEKAPSGMSKCGR